MTWAGAILTGLLMFAHFSFGAETAISSSHACRKVTLQSCGGVVGGFYRAFASQTMELALESLVDSCASGYFIDENGDSDFEGGYNETDEYDFEKGEWIKVQYPNLIEELPHDRASCSHYFRDNPAKLYCEMVEIPLCVPKEPELPPACVKVSYGTCDGSVRSKAGQRFHSFDFESGGRSLFDARIEAYRKCARGISPKGQPECLKYFQANPEGLHCSKHSKTICGPVDLEEYNLKLQGKNPTLLRKPSK